MTLDQGLEALDLAVIGAGIGFEAQASDSTQWKEDKIKNMKMAVARDAETN